MCTADRRSVQDVPHLRTHHIWGFVLLACALMGFSTPAIAQSVDPVVENEVLAQAYTQNLIVATSEYQSAQPSERPDKLARVQLAAQRRLDRMVRLAQLNPKKFLKLVLPADIRKSLPRDVQIDFEEETETEGTLQVFHVDYRTTSYYEYVLRSPIGDLSLQFAENPPQVPTGTRIKVKGIKARHVMAMGSGPGGTGNTGGPQIAGARSTAVIMVNFSDKNNAYTQDQIRNVVFGQTSDFDKENSYQQAWLSGDVFGPFTISMGSGGCDYNGIMNQARSAASGAGNNLSQYKHFVYMFPQNGCGWWGLGTIGGSPSHAWINGSVQYSVVAHEMGHNFGLYHSHALECGNATLAPACQSIEYGDTLDVMGTSGGHFNAFQKERLGWLNTTGTPPITTIQYGGQYLIDAYETPGSGSKAIKIPKGSTGGNKSWYYVEYRQPIGFDGFVGSNSNVKNGVVIHTGTDSSPDSSFLLDMTGNTSSWNDPALGSPQIFQDPESAVNISVAWLTGTTAAVNVNTGVQPCTRANPVVSISPAEGMALLAGKAGTYTVNVTNADNTTCSASSFSVSATPPGGWAGGANTSLTISPGKTASTSFKVTSPTSAGDGAYNIPITVTSAADSSKSATTSAKYVVIMLCVRNNPTVTVSPVQGPSVVAGTNVPYGVSVANNDSLGCTASSFAMSYKVPGGFTASFPTASLSIAPGQSVSTTFNAASGKDKKFGVGSYGMQIKTSSLETGKKDQADAVYVIGATAPK